MPRNQPYDPSFSYDLGEGYLMNPQTGEIFNTATNTAYASADELGMEIQAQSQGGNTPSQGSSGATGQQALGGIGSLASTGTGLYSALGGGTAAATGGGAALGGSAVTGGTAVGSSITGGTMLANGTVAPMTAGTYGSGTAAGGGVGLGTVAWPLAILLSTIKAGHNFEKRKEESGGELSRQDLSSVTHMWGDPAWGWKPGQRAQAFLDKVPGSPTWIANALFGSGRAAQERGMRKVGRRSLQEAGLMNEDSRSRYNRADGSQFDISQYKADTGKDAYNINFDGTENADDISFLNAISSAILGDKKRQGSDVKDGKTSSDLTGELYNTAYSGGDANANVRFMGDKVGGRDVIYNGVAEQFKAGRIDANKRDALFAAIDKEYGIANPTGARWEDTAGLDEKQRKRNDEQLAQGNKIPKAPASTTKPIVTPFPLTPNNGGLNTSSTGGKPATPINTGTYRPGSSVNPNFKGGQRQQTMGQTGFKIPTGKQSKSLNLNPDLVNQATSGMSGYADLIKLAESGMNGVKNNQPYKIPKKK